MLFFIKSVFFFYLIWEFLPWKKYSLTSFHLNIYFILATGDAKDMILNFNMYCNIKSDTRSSK